MKNETDVLAQDRLTAFFSLFTSGATLICCALPSLFVLLGAGAAFASLIGTFPFLITLSHYKVHISVTALVMLVIAGYANYRSYYAPCPSDPELGRACMQTRKTSRIIYYVAVGIFLFASLFTYVVPSFL